MESTGGRKVRLRKIVQRLNTYYPDAATALTRQSLELRWRPSFPPSVPTSG